MADADLPQNVVMEKMWDLQPLMSQLNRSLGPGAWLCDYRTWATKAQRATTLSKHAAFPDEASVDYTVCLPIAPYVTFDDLARARQQSPASCLASWILPAT